MPQPALLPRAEPADVGVSAVALGALLDRLDEKGIECHSVMVVRRGHVVAEGWWAPYSADRPHLLYSLTKSFTAMAVGLAVADGLLSVDDLVVDVLPDGIPDDIPAQARRLTVHHLLTMTAGHDTDTLGPAWELEPGDLVRGFLRMPFAAPEGTMHTYDNATTFVLARMVERVTGCSLPEYLDERLFAPMGIGPAEWDRVSSGAAFGFHGLHLTTEAVAAFGELLRCGGRWGDAQLLPEEWVELATSSHIDSRHYADGADGADYLAGYGYQIWRSRHGFHGNGAFGQHCIVVPSDELVVAVTSAQHEVRQAQDVLDAVWDCLLPGLDHPDAAREDALLAERLRGMALPVVAGEPGPTRTVAAVVAAVDDEVTAVAEGTAVVVEGCDGAWRVDFKGLFALDVGHGRWRESAPLGRPVCATGAWQGDVFVADLRVIRSPHHVRLRIDARTGVATATWVTVPLTSPLLELHLRAPLMTRPDVA
ncbi:serine hydrolase domain-containing protein [Microbacterium kyungheense]|uniref:CubicO group peptidase (Beta-lactamase class C family) n=1 Tax=Microbacterium kyungheense TaxID=1263636 RepID=A0A543EUP5_9MICO|nr:serine hydrolase [Microbacterium kyungheense]TQM25289.1 CubicO group peptidase (beta-lactamase class C family) [Microbacterium kyungheense]